jgi:hypothetical protein
MLFELCVLELGNRLDMRTSILSRFVQWKKCENKQSEEKRGHHWKKKGDITDYLIAVYGNS